jgi:hypothetical protein
MTDTPTASERITDEVTSWPGVEAGSGRRGEFAFKLGGHEIGHLHGDHAAHFGFPKSVWTELMEQGRIVEHPVFPGKAGPGARRIETQAARRRRLAPGGDLGDARSSALDIVVRDALPRRGREHPREITRGMRLPPPEAGGDLTVVVGDLRQSLSNAPPYRARVVTAKGSDPQ